MFTILKQKKGFTLVELLVVISIIALLSSIVLSSVGQGRTRARDAQRKLMVRQLQTALELYRNDKGEYPKSGTSNTDALALALPAGQRPGDSGVCTDSTPNASWTTSSDANCWATLEVALSPYIKSLAVDPLQTSSYPWGNTANYGFAYFAANGGAGWCDPGQFYIIVYRPENSGVPSPGVYICNDTYNGNTGIYQAGNGTVTVGVSQKLK